MGLFSKKQDKVVMRKRNNLLRNLGYYIVVIVFLVIAFIGLQIDSQQYKKEVALVALKEDVGNRVITEKDLVPYKMLKADVKKGMIRWSEREEKVIGMYPNMQIRKEVPLYEDMLRKDQKVRYEYLYELTPNEELLTFKYDHTAAGGRIPRPGDRFRIRGSYKLSDEEIELLKAGQLKVDNINETKDDVVDEEGELLIQSSPDDWDIINGDVRTKLIFDVVTVVDMLNSNGDSIYEVIRDLEALPKDQQEAKLQEDSVKTALTPYSLLLIVKSDQVSRYVEFQSNKNAVYTLTVLSRDKSLMEDDLKIGDSLLDNILKDTNTTEPGGDN